MWSFSGHLCLCRKSKHYSRGRCALSEWSEWNMPTSALSLNATLPHVWILKTRDYIKHRSWAFQSWQCLWIHYFCSSKHSVATEKGIHLPHAHLRSTKIQFFWKIHWIPLAESLDYFWLFHLWITIPRKRHSFVFSWEMSVFSNKLICFCRGALFHRWAQEEDDGRGGQKCGYPVPSSRWVLYVRNLNRVGWIDLKVYSPICFTHNRHTKHFRPSQIHALHRALRAFVVSNLSYVKVFIAIFTLHSLHCHPQSWMNSQEHLAGLLTNPKGCACSVWGWFIKSAHLGDARIPSLKTNGSLSDEWRRVYD